MSRPQNTRPQVTGQGTPSRWATSAPCEAAGQQHRPRVCWTAVKATHHWEGLAKGKGRGSQGGELCSQRGLWEGAPLSRSVAGRGRDHRQVHSPTVVPYQQYEACRQRRQVKRLITSLTQKPDLALGCLAPESVLSSPRSPCCSERRGLGVVTPRQRGQSKGSAL